MSSEIFYAKDSFGSATASFLSSITAPPIATTLIAVAARSQNDTGRSSAILFVAALPSRQRKSSRSQPHLRKLTQKIAAGPVKAETVHLRWANSAAGYWPGSSPPTQ